MERIAHQTTDDGGWVWGPGQGEIRQAPRGSKENGLFFALPVVGITKSLAHSRHQCKIAKRYN